MRNFVESSYSQGNDEQCFEEISSSSDFEVTIYVSLPLYEN